MKNQEALQACLMFGTPAFLTGVLLAFSYKRLRLVELLEPIYYSVFALFIAVINNSNICGEPFDNLR